MKTKHRDEYKVEVPTHSGDLKKSKYFYRKITK